MGTHAAFVYYATITAAAGLPDGERKYGLYSVTLKPCCNQQARSMVLAVAKLFPQLTLPVNHGSQAFPTAALFGADSMIWNLGEQLAKPLFNST